MQPLGPTWQISGRRLLRPPSLAAAAPPTFPPSSWPSSGTVMVLGDSISVLYAPYLAELLAPRSVDQRGIGGETSLDVAARIDAELLREPAVIVLLVGVNDRFRTTIYPESSGPPLTPSQSIAYIATIVDRAAAAGVPVVLSTILPCSAFAGWTPGAQADTVATNAGIRRMAADLGLPLLDGYAYAASWDDPTALHAGWESTDGLHPGVAGLSFLANGVLLPASGNWTPPVAPTITLPAISGATVAVTWGFTTSICGVIATEAPEPPPNRRDHRWRAPFNSYAWQPGADGPRRLYVWVASESGVLATGQAVSGECEVTL